MKSITRGEEHPLSFLQFCLRNAWTILFKLIITMGLFWWGMSLTGFTLKQCFGIIVLAWSYAQSTNGKGIN